MGLFRGKGFQGRGRLFRVMRQRLKATWTGKAGIYYTSRSFIFLNDTSLETLSLGAVSAQSRPVSSGVPRRRSGGTPNHRRL